VEDLESIIMELLVNAGAARSSALTALQLARKGDFEGAGQAMEESREFVKLAHGIQTPQDHLMNAMVIQDLATDMIELYRRIPLVS